MMNHLICPRCADKLTEVAMIHQMVYDSNSFFERQRNNLNNLPAGSSPNIPIIIDGPSISTPAYEFRPAFSGHTFFKKHQERRDPISTAINLRRNEQESGTSSRNQRNNTPSTSDHVDWVQFNGPLVASDSEDEDEYVNNEKQGKSSFMRNGRKV